MAPIRKNKNTAGPYTRADGQEEEMMPAGSYALLAVSKRKMAQATNCWAGATPQMPSPRLPKAPFLRKNTIVGQTLVKKVFVRESGAG